MSVIEDRGAFQSVHTAAHELGHRSDHTPSSLNFFRPCHSLDEAVIIIIISFSWSVSWRFKPSQPQSIIFELKETFIKERIVERINKAETRLEEQSEKAESCREHLWNEMQLKGPYRQK